MTTIKYTVAPSADKHLRKALLRANLSCNPITTCRMSLWECLENLIAQMRVLMYTTFLPTAAFSWKFEAFPRPGQCLEHTTHLYRSFPELQKREKPLYIAFVQHNKSAAHGLLILQEVPGLLGRSFLCVLSHSFASAEGGEYV